MKLQTNKSKNIIKGYEIWIIKSHEILNHNLAPCRFMGDSPKPKFLVGRTIKEINLLVAGPTLKHFKYDKINQINDYRYICC